MSYVERNLLPNEQVIYKTRLHWIEYVAKGLWWIIAGLMICFPFAIYLETFLLAMGLFGLFGLLEAWINVATSEFAVTNNRVLVKVGLIRRHSLEIVLRQVEGIGVDQGILGNPWIWHHHCFGNGGNQRDLHPDKQAA